MGYAILRNISTDIRKAQWFSSIADETSDISNKEQLSVCIRWVGENFIAYEDPLELINLSKPDAYTISYQCIEGLFNKVCLPITQCHDQAYV